jgi:hypothetical protein
MKPIILFLTLLLSGSAARAQEERDDTLMSVPPTVSEHRYWAPAYGSFYSPVGPAALGAWDLHPGLNAQVGAGVRVGWGKHNPWRGASFFSNAALLYATPLSSDGRWTGAVGGYHSNYRLWGRQVNTLGIMGMVDYRINDRLNVGGFLMHDFGVVGGARGMGRPMLPFESPSTTLGADLGIRLTQNAALSVGISFTRYEDSFMPPPPPVPAVRR